MKSSNKTKYHSDYSENLDKIHLQKDEAILSHQNISLLGKDDINIDGEIKSINGNVSLDSRNRQTTVFSGAKIYGSKGVVINGGKVSISGSISSSSGVKISGGNVVINKNANIIANNINIGSNTSQNINLDGNLSANNIKVTGNNIDSVANFVADDLQLSANKMLNVTDGSIVAKNLKLGDNKIFIDDKVIIDIENITYNKK